MTIEVSQAQSWEEFKKAWINGMKHLHWFKEQKIFEYNQDKELEELHKNFHTSTNLFRARAIELLRRKDL